MLGEKLSRRNATKSNDVQIQKRRVRDEYGTPKGVRKLELSRTINISLLRSEALLDRLTLKPSTGKIGRDVLC